MFWHFLRAQFQDVHIGREALTAYPHLLHSQRRVSPFIKPTAAAYVISSHLRSEEHYQNLPKPGSPNYKRHLRSLDPLYSFYDTRTKKIVLFVLFVGGCYLAYLPLRKHINIPTEEYEVYIKDHELYTKKALFDELTLMLKDRKKISTQVDKLKNNILNLFSHRNFLPNVLLPRQKQDEQEDFLGVDRLNDDLKDKPTINYSHLVNHLKAIPGAYFNIPPHLLLYEYLTYVLPDFPQNIGMSGIYPSFNVLPILILPNPDVFPAYLLYATMKLKYPNDPMLWIRCRSNESETLFTQGLCSSLGLDPIILNGFEDSLIESLNLIIDSCQKASDGLQAKGSHYMKYLLDFKTFGPMPPYASPIKIFIQMDMGAGVDIHQLSKWCQVIHQFSRSLMDQEIAQVYIVTNTLSFPLFWERYTASGLINNEVAYYQLPDTHTELRKLVQLQKEVDSQQSSLTIWQGLRRKAYHLHMILNYYSEKYFMYDNSVDFYAPIETEEVYSNKKGKELTPLSTQKHELDISQWKHRTPLEFVEHVVQGQKTRDLLQWWWPFYTTSSLSKTKLSLSEALQNDTSLHLLHDLIRERVIRLSITNNDLRSHTFTLDWQS